MALAGRSCRTRDDREAIRFGGRSPAPRRVGRRRRGGGARFMCSICRGEGRRHLVDGARRAAPRRPRCARRWPCSCPTGWPWSRDRRPAGARTSTGFCAALWPARSETRRAYSRALAQRNELLGRIRAGAADPSSLDAWDRGARGPPASRWSTPAARRPSCWRRRSRRRPSELGLGGGASSSTGRAARRPSADALAAELAERRDADLARGYTGWGPHLDEVALESAAARCAATARRASSGSACWRCCSPSGRRCSTTGGRRR